MNLDEKFKVNDRVSIFTDDGWVDGTVHDVSKHFAHIIRDDGKYVDGVTPRGTWVVRDTDGMLHIPSSSDPTTTSAAVVNTTSPLPMDSTVRKTYPLYSGLLAYFPAALSLVSHHSHLGNEKHNPGKELQHARLKSTDHKDCIIRHLLDAQDTDAELEELTAVAWRALALLQETAEKHGYPVAPAATFGGDDAD